MSRDGRSIKIYNRIGEKLKLCREKHGQHSIVDDTGCSCEREYVMVDNECVHRDLQCKHLGPEGKAYFRNEQWQCGCPYRYFLAGDPPICESHELACQESFGLGAEWVEDSDNCRCKFRYHWNPERTHCIRE